jgi:hypothetical protein
MGSCCGKLFEKKVEIASDLWGMLLITATKKQGFGKTRRKKGLCA